MRNSGHVKPFELVAILGPSGAGKTSLLNVLSQRHSTSSGFVDGQVKINGRDLKQGDFGKIAAFVQQDDVLGESLTARELFIFACRIRLDLNETETTARVESVIRRLSLQKCCDQIIGGWLRTGVSGGERKRISIGYEVITNPSLLLLDEPTSGLDSSTALKIGALLKKEAQRGVSIITTIHQPSSQLLKIFDRVICLAQGYTIYNGSPMDLGSHFGKFGLQEKRFANPAERLLKIACMPEMELNPGVTIEQLAITSTEPFQTPRELKITETRNVNQFKQFQILLQRQILELRRSFVIVPLALFVALMNGFLFSSLFWQKADFEMTQTDVRRIIRDLVGLSFTLAADQLLEMEFGQIIIIPKVFPVFKREVLSNMYKPLPFYAARVVMSILTYILYPFVVTLTSIWCLGVPELGVVTFLSFQGVMVVLALIGSAMGLTIGIVIPESLAALTVSELSTTIFIFGSGVFANTATSANILVKLITWLSPLHYGVELFMRMLIKNQNEDFQASTMETLGYTDGVLKCCLVLAAFYIFFLLTGLIAIHRLAKN